MNSLLSNGFVLKVNKAFRLGVPMLTSTLTRPKRLYRISLKALDIWRREGIGALKQAFLLRARRDYKKWRQENTLLSDDDRTKIRTRIEQLAHRPLISVLMPTFNTDPRWLRRAVKSVQKQLYPNWELCIADDCSTLSGTLEVLRSLQKSDSRVKMTFRGRNGHISAASNSALELATGEFTALLDHDDELTEHALYMIAEEVNAHPNADMIYSDEDKVDENDYHFEPYFKPEWNQDLFYSQNFINHLGVYRTSLLKKIGGFREGFEGSQDYDLILRLIEETSPDRIRHIPHVLYHWRAIRGSVALHENQKTYPYERARKAIQEHLNRVGISAQVKEGYRSFHRLIYPVPTPVPLVSLVIGTRDRVDLLRGIVDGILYRTDYQNLEILILDNQSSKSETLEYFESLKSESRVRVLKYDAPFNFSAMNNWGVRQARGEIIGLLNNDLLVIHPEWLREMVSHAIRPGVGAVGAKLYYANNTLQHGGLVLGIGGVAGHSHRHFGRSEAGYIGRLQLVHETSGVTAACILTKRSVFDELNGLNEHDLKVAFNDVDFCLRVREAGYRIIWTPYAELYHLESASRGSDMTPDTRPRFQVEFDYMIARWGEKLKNDPFYSPNLSLECESFGYAKHSRARKPWKQHS